MWSVFGASRSLKTFTCILIQIVVLRRESLSTGEEGFKMRPYSSLVLQASSVTPPSFFKSAGFRSYISAELFVLVLCQIFVFKRLLRWSWRTLSLPLAISNLSLVVNEWSSSRITSWRVVNSDFYPFYIGPLRKQFCFVRIRSFPFLLYCVTVLNRSRPLSKEASIACSLFFFFPPSRRCCGRSEVFSVNLVCFRIPIFVSIFSLSTYKIFYFYISCVT
jgi:hypothetical protein